MLPLHLGRPAGVPLRVMLVGAHCDDIEIGCGATVLALLAARPDTQVTWVVLSGTAEREREARESAALFLRDGSGGKEVIVEHFRDGHFPYQGSELKEVFERLKREHACDLVFTHHRDDRHQDHRMASELAWNTWRDQTILEYEIPKYDGELGSPNCFVPIDEATWSRKIRTICDVYQSQAHRDWMAPDMFKALMRLRGLECAAPTRHAEAFHCRKLVLGF